LKIILSRKGVDSSAGGFASPIFPDRSLLSIPIPDLRSPHQYRDLSAAVPAAGTLGRLVYQLSNGRLRGSSRVHIDPDLDSATLPREPGWRALFGQCGAASQHLRGQGVGRGDLFLFFGWFREVEYHQRRWRYRPDAPDQHVIFGWLLVGECVSLDDAIETRPGWMHYHPHLNGDFALKNCLYTSATAVECESCPVLLPRRGGAGLCETYADARGLTAKGMNRSQWQLPGWLYPQSGRTALSYHASPQRWSRANGSTRLQAASRGQEFVLDCDAFPQAIEWAGQLLAA